MAFEGILKPKLEIGSGGVSQGIIYKEIQKPKQDSSQYKISSSNLNNNRSNIVP